MQLFSLGFVVELNDDADGEERMGGQEVAVSASISISLSLVLWILLLSLFRLFFLFVASVLADSLYSPPKNISC